MKAVIKITVALDDFSAMRKVQVVEVQDVEADHGHLGKRAHTALEELCATLYEEMVRANGGIRQGTLLGKGGG